MTDLNRTTNLAKLKATPKKEKKDLSIDQLLAELREIGKHPRCPILKVKAQEIEKEAKAIIRTSLELLVPDLCELEKANKPDLNIQIACKICSSLKKIKPDELENIGKAVGLDRSRYKNQEAFVESLSQKMRDTLYRPKDLGQALNIISASKLVKEIDSGKSRLSERIKLLDKMCLDAADAILDSKEALKNAFREISAKQIEKIPVTTTQVASFLFRRTRSRRLFLNHIKNNTPTTIYELIEEACEELDTAAEHIHKVEQKEKEQDTLKEHKGDRIIEEFLNLHPELEHILASLLNDRAFRDGAVTPVQRFAALETAKTIKSSELRARR
jgi:hypothetical protein